MRQFLAGTLAGMALLASLTGCGGQQQAVRTTANPDGTQQAQITARHGYQPQSIVAEAGKPLKLEFFRDETETKSCVSELVIPEAGVNTVLPPRETTVVEIPPQEPGEMIFKCGMDMMHGKVTFLPSEEFSAAAPAGQQ